MGTKLKAFAITFGQAHPLRDNYCVIIAPDASKARAGAFQTFGEKWAFFYEYAEMEAQEKEFGLKPLVRRIRVDEYGHASSEFNNLAKLWECEHVGS